MQSSRDVMPSVDQLAGAPEWTPAAVQACTHVPLTPADGANPFFSTLKGAASDGALAAVELRIPGQGAAPETGPMLVLTVAAGLKADLADLTKRFGTAVDLRPAPPTAARGQVPTYYTFRRGDTTIHVGVSTADDEIRTIVLERPRR